MILFPVKSFSDGLRAGSNLFVNKVKFFLHGVGGCADSANIFIKNADFGGVVLPEGTDKRATFHVASLSLDTSGYKNILIQLAFSCNIIAEKLKLRLRFQILRQESGQGVTVPVSAGILYYQDKVCSEANSFTLSVYDRNAAAEKCCVYSVLVDIEEFDMGGSAIIANPTLIATVVGEV